MRVIPEVAAGFPKVTRDGKTYTIGLKRTYRFHDGKPATAANYVEAFNRDANPSMRSPAITMPFFCPVRVGEAIEPQGIKNPPGSGPYYVAEHIPGRGPTSTSR